MDLSKPIFLLQKEVDENKRALEKSFSLYAEGQIDAKTHVTHKDNLTRNIDGIESALSVLKFLQKWNEQN